MSDGPFTVTVEGAEELERNWLAAAHGLETDTNLASIRAADDGVRAMQERHPYTDRTYDLSGSMVAVPINPASTGDDTVFEAEMYVPADYASYVDKGTTRSKPYPFTPRGESTAERTLAREEQAAVDTFERSCKRG